MMRLDKESVADKYSDRSVVFELNRFCDQVAVPSRAVNLTDLESVFPLALVFAPTDDTYTTESYLPRNLYETMPSPFSLNISPSPIVPGVRSQARRLRVGRHIAVLLPLIYQTFGNAKQRLVQRLRRSRCATRILPVAAGA